MLAHSLHSHGSGPGLGNGATHSGLDLPLFVCYRHTQLDLDNSSLRFPSQVILGCVKLTLGSNQYTRFSLSVREGLYWSFLFLPPSHPPSLPLSLSRSLCLYPLFKTRSRITHPKIGIKLRMTLNSRPSCLPTAEIQACATPASASQCWDYRHAPHLALPPDAGITGICHHYLALH